MFTVNKTQRLIGHNKQNSVSFVDNQIQEDKFTAFNYVTKASKARDNINTRESIKKFLLLELRAAITQNRLD